MRLGKASIAAFVLLELTVAALRLPKIEFPAHTMRISFHYFTIYMIPLSTNMALL